MSTPHVIDLTGFTHVEFVHTCPACWGQGTVSRPPWVAGDVTEWVSCGTAYWPCHPCNGRGVIVTPSAVPPQVSA